MPDGNYPEDWRTLCELASKERDAKELMRLLQRLNEVGGVIVANFGGAATRALGGGGATTAEEEYAVCQCAEARAVSLLAGE
jgi:hypothetical protein